MMLYFSVSGLARQSKGPQAVGSPEPAWSHQALERRLAVGLSAVMLAAGQAVGRRRRLAAGWVVEPGGWVVVLVRHLWRGRTPHKGSSTPLVPLGRTDKTECRLPMDTYIPRDIHKVALGCLWCQVGPWPSRHFSKAWWLAVGLS